MYITDKKKSLAVFLAVFGLYTLVYMTKNCFSAAMAAIVDTGMLTKFQTGMVTAVFYALYAPLQPVGGLLADRRNPTTLITVGLLGGALANGAIYFFPYYPVMLVAWGVNAVVQLGVWPGIFRIIATQLHPAHRQQATFLIAFSTPGGLMLSFLVAALLPRWQANFALSAIVLCLLAGGFWLICRSLTFDNHAENHATPAAVAMSTARLYRRSGFMLIVGYVALRTLVEMGVKTLSATMLAESYDAVTPAAGNMVGALIILAGIMGTVGVHRLLCRTQHNEMTVTLWLLVLCIPLLALGCFITLPLGSLTLVLCIVTAALSGTHYLLMRATLRFAKYGKSGFVAGLTNGAASLGIILQSAVTTSLADQHGWQAVWFSWLALISVCVCLVALALPKWCPFCKGDDRA